MVKGTVIDNNFSPTQLEAIELFAQGILNCSQIAEQLNVSPSTLTNWRRNQYFMEAVVSRSRELLRHALPEIYKVAIDKSVKGDHKHIKILLDHLDNIDKTKIEKNHASITFVWDMNDNPDTLSTSSLPTPDTSGYFTV